LGVHAAGVWLAGQQAAGCRRACRRSRAMQYAQVHAAMQIALNITLPLLTRPQKQQQQCVNQRAHAQRAPVAPASDWHSCRMRSSSGPPGPAPLCRFPFSCFCCCSALSRPGCGDHGAPAACHARPQPAAGGLASGLAGGQLAVSGPRIDCLRGIRPLLGSGLIRPLAGERLAWLAA